MSDPTIFLMHIAYRIGVYSIAALSLNIEYGYTGLSNFGKAAFLMVGAYTAALAVEAGLNPVVAVALSMAVSAVVGVAASLPALRLREDYLAITTLAFAEILRILVRNMDDVAEALIEGLTGSPVRIDFFGGVHGKSVESFIRIPGDFRVYNMAQLGLVYGVLAVSYVLIRLISDSPYGRILKAVREDELAAQVLGMRTWMYKVQVLGLGSALAGLAGALNGQFEGYISPDHFQPSLTFAIWMMVILGGSANNLGVILGAALVESIEASALFAKDFLGYLPFDPVNLQWIFVGASIVAVVAFKPQGLLPESHVKTPAVEEVRVGSTRG